MTVGRWIQSRTRCVAHRPTKTPANEHHDAPELTLHLSQDNDSSTIAPMQPPHGHRLRLLAPLLCVLAACAQGPRIQWNHPSVNQDSRVQFLVVHATEIDFATSLQALTHGDVSSHYLVDRDGSIYGLVPESRRAWHAGPSYWEGTTPLNPSSIGIEVVSVPKGMPEGTEAPFPEPQIAAVRDLIADIAKRHHIRPNRIVGHGEVQPEGRTDPGRLFPWSSLIDAGLIPAPDPNAVNRFRQAFERDPPGVRWLQEQLSAHGYRIQCSGVFDGPTKQVLTVFQGRYRPGQVDGEADPETLGILAALTSPDGLRMRTSRDGWRALHVDPPPQARCLDP